VECLHALYTRGLQDEEFVELVGPMYTSESINVFREVYNWSVVDANDLDDEKYKLCKKLSEFLSNLAHLVDLRNHLLDSNADITTLLFLLYDIMRNASLVVSIPILHIWTRLLRNRNLRDTDAVGQLIQGLLETCSERLIRYEALPEDTNDPTITLLNDDIDTLPERHAFLGNYRRYCVDVIEVIVRKSPLEALQHILGQAGQLFDWLNAEVPPNSPNRYSRNSTANLKADAQVTVVDAALKGYLKWTNSLGSQAPQEVEETRNQIQNFLVEWCQNGPIKARYDDPDIMKKLIQMLVTFATKSLSTRPAFAAMVLEYIINVSDLGKGIDTTNYPQLVEAYKNFDVTCTVEMQRLAMAFPDHLIGIYDELEQRINVVISSKTSDEKMRLGYMGFLFIIVHRCTTIPQDAKEARLRSMLQPVRDAWTDPKLAEGLDSFESFCHLLNLDQVASFLERMNFANTKDWSSTPLDAEGQALQAEINSRFQALPLRLTKSLLGASTEKMGRDNAVYSSARSLWSDLVPIILPNLLQMINHAQAFNNLDNWQHLSAPLQGVMQRVMTDRFWQSGISTESRDDFFARVSGSKHTYEGLASTIRGTVRQIREAGYFMLYNLANFGDMMYGISDLPGPMSRALFQNAHALSAHHVSVLLGVAAPLVEMCPTQCREQFLPPFLSGLFGQLERKIGQEWEHVRAMREQRSDGEDGGLGDEMKKESILRQLTFSSVSLAGTCLEFKHPGK
jgi:exportin-5